MDFVLESLFYNQKNKIIAKYMHQAILEEDLIAIDYLLNHIEPDKNKYMIDYQYHAPCHIAIKQQSIYLLKYFITQSEKENINLSFHYFLEIPKINKTYNSTTNILSENVWIKLLKTALLHDFNSGVDQMVEKMIIGSSTQEIKSCIVEQTKDFIEEDNVHALLNIKNQPLLKVYCHPLLFPDINNINDLVEYLFLKNSKEIFSLLLDEGVILYEKINAKLLLDIKNNEDFLPIIERYEIRKEVKSLPVKKKELQKI